MDKLLKAYYDALKKEPDHIDVSKELLKAWLDDKIETQKAANEILRKHNADLYYGNLKDGNYEKKVRVCGFEVRPGLHIYSGLRLLADALGVDVKKKERNDNTYPWEISFDYKGFNIFQIGGDDL